MSEKATTDERDERRRGRLTAVASERRAERRAEELRNQSDKMQAGCPLIGGVMSNLVDLAALEAVTRMLKDADASSTVSLSTARQLCSELNYAVALLAAADKVCEYAQHGRLCNLTLDMSSNCDCGLQLFKDAYHTLKGKPDAK